MTTSAPMYLFGTAEKNLSEIDVSPEDYDDIVEVTFLTDKCAQLQLDIAVSREQIRTLKDASEEVMICFEPDGVMTSLGQCFSRIDEADAIEKNEAELTKEQEKCAKSETELDEEIDKLRILKAKLHQKFGDDLHLGDFVVSRTGIATA